MARISASKSRKKADGQIEDFRGLVASEPRAGGLRASEITLERIRRSFENETEPRRKLALIRQCISGYEQLFGEDRSPARYLLGMAASIGNDASYRFLEQLKDNGYPEAKFPLFEIYTNSIQRHFSIDSREEVTQHGALAIERLHSNLPRLKKHEKFVSAEAALAIASRSPNDVEFSSYLGVCSDAAFHYTNFLRIGKDSFRTLLPAMIRLAPTADAFRDLDYEVRSLASAFESPGAYLQTFLPILLGGCGSTGDLRKNDGELRRLIDTWGYAPDKSGYPTWYTDIPQLLAKIRFEDLDAFIGIFHDYKERYGEPMNFIRKALLPMLSESTDIRTIYWLKDLIKRSTFKPDLAVSTAYPMLIKAGALNERSYDEINDMIILSGSKIDENIKLMKSMNASNAVAIVGDFKCYVIDMGALYLEGIYERYVELPPAERKVFASKLDGMKRKIALGTDQYEDAEEYRRLQFLAVKSGFMTYESFQRVMKSIDAGMIPPPNLCGRTTVILNSRSVKLDLSDEDKAKISDARSFIATSVGTDAGASVVALAGIFRGKFENPRLVLPPGEKKAALASFYQTVSAMDRPQKVQLLYEALVELAAKMEPHGRAYEHFTKMALICFYHRNAYLRTKVDELEKSDDFEAAFKMEDIFLELREEMTGFGLAPEEVRAERDLHTLNRSLRGEDEGVIRLGLIPSKRPIDAFFGSYGETCLSGRYDEIYNPSFTPIRITDGEVILGGVYTLTEVLLGKKTLLMVGMEPKEKVIERVNASEFVEKMIASLISMCKDGGYDAIAQSLNGSAISNRRPVRNALTSLVEGLTVYEIPGIRFAGSDVGNFVVLATIEKEGKPTQ